MAESHKLPVFFVALAQNAKASYAYVRRHLILPRKGNVKSILPKLVSFIRRLGIACASARVQWLTVKYILQTVVEQTDEKTTNSGISGDPVASAYAPPRGSDWSEWQCKHNVSVAAPLGPVPLVALLVPPAPKGQGTPQTTLDRLCRPSLLLPCP